MFPFCLYVCVSSWGWTVQLSLSFSRVEKGGKTQEVNPSDFWSVGCWLVYHQALLCNFVLLHMPCISPFSSLLMRRLGLKNSNSSHIAHAFKMWVLFIKIYSLWQQSVRGAKWWLKKIYQPRKQFCCCAGFAYSLLYSVTWPRKLIGDVMCLGGL